MSVEGEKGKGSCFTIHLPLYDEKAERDQERNANRGSRSRGRGRSKTEGAESGARKHEG